MGYDSAGVRIVENTDPQWGPGGGWRVGPEPRVQIGTAGGDPDYELYRVVGALRLSDGTIVIGNAGTQQLRYYDASGAYNFSAGGEGGGPGEFATFAAMWRSTGDDVEVFDYRQRRYSRYSPGGRFIDVRRLAHTDQTTNVFAVGGFADGSFLVETYPRPDPSQYTPPPLGRRLLTAPLFRYDPRGRRADELGSYPVSETLIYERQGGRYVGTPAFQRVGLIVSHRDRVYAAFNESYEIRVSSMRGRLLQFIRREHEPPPVDDDAIERLKQHWLSLSEYPERIESQFRQMSFPATMPAMGVTLFGGRRYGLLVDEVDHIWVREYSPPWEETNEWAVFDPAGQWLGTVTIPAGLILYDIGDDYVLGKWRDDLDVEYVRLHDLVKPSR